MATVSLIRAPAEHFRGSSALADEPGLTDTAECGEVHSNLTPLVDAVVSLLFVFMIQMFLSATQPHLRLHDQSDGPPNDDRTTGQVFVSQEGIRFREPGQPDLKLFRSIGDLARELKSCQGGWAVQIFSAKEVAAGTIFAAREALLSAGVSVEGLGPWPDRPAQGEAE